MFRRFGSSVTVIGHSEQILSQQDPDIAIAVQTLLERNGIEFLLKTKVLRVERSGHATVFQLQVADREMSLQKSHLLVAVGRAVTTDTLNLAAASVAVDTRRFIPVNRLLAEVGKRGRWGSLWG